jgi:hypothetical protein
MSYGTTFWGNSVDSKEVLYVQKKIIRIMAGTERTVCYTDLRNLIFFH